MADVKRYTVGQLVESLRAAGLDVTPRRIRDWVGQGLLDDPSSPGLGRGRGRAGGTWPEKQRRLLEVLLRQSDGGAPFKQLFNIPVWLWMAWGDDYVPRRQAAKALRRWCSTGTSWQAAQRAAREVVADLKSRRLPRSVQKRVVEELATALISGEYETPGFRDAAHDLIDPLRLGMPRGPVDAPLTPDTYLDVITARVIATHRLDQTSPAEFADARDIYRSMSGTYEEDAPRLSRDPEIGGIFRLSKNPAENACTTLLTILGLEEMRRRGLIPHKRNGQRRPKTQ